MEGATDGPALVAQNPFSAPCQEALKVIDWRKYLVSRRDVASGQLCAKGTRVPVPVILDSLAEGASADEIITSYPSLKTAHIRAAIAYAAALAREEQLTPLSADAHKTRREPARRTG